MFLSNQESKNNFIGEFCTECLLLSSCLFRSPRINEYGCQSNCTILADSPRTCSSHLAFRSGFNSTRAEIETSVHYL